MKKNKGFTLVELLAIIAILGVMVILVVPQIGGSINAKKEKEFEKIMDIVESAAKAYHTFNNVDNKIPIATLVSEKYLTNDLINPITNEKLDGCVRVDKDNEGIVNYRYTSCESIEVPVTIELKGGTSTQFLQEINKNVYYDTTKIELIDPKKPWSNFVKWIVVKGNSYIIGKTLVVGDTETIVYATWESWPTLTVELNGGTPVQSFETFYKTGTTIELLEPDKDGYIFSGWTVSGTGAILSGTNLTIGTGNVTLTANWEAGSLITYYRCNKNSVGSSSKHAFTYTGNCTVIDDGNGNWRVKFLTSGTLVFNKKAPAIDVFLVGGGGGGAGHHGNHAACGGAGGYTKTEKNVMPVSNADYSIVIGGGGYGGSAWNGGGTGGASSAFGAVANGGGGAKYTSGAGYGGSGGSGGGSGSLGGKQGAGGSDGSNGYGGYKGAGQGTTTREFGESDGTLYAGGGGGQGASGGAGGGGTGPSSSNGYAGAANTGGGGGGGGAYMTGDDTDPWKYCSGGSGGSGIVVIRNARQ